MGEAEEDNDMKIGDYDNDDMPFKDGDMVELHSIQKFAQLNGMVGEITGYFENSKRYEVKLVEARKPYKLKATNLKVCENQKLSKQQYENRKLKKSTDAMLQHMQRQKMEQEQQKIMYLLCGLFGSLLLITLWSSGALGYIYRDSFAAPYLQMVGEPIKENVLLPIYDYALVPVYNNALVPIYENVLQPLQAVLKTFSTSVAEYVLKPLYEKVILPTVGLITPIVSMLQDSVTQIKDVIKGVLSPIFGSAVEEATGTASETVADAAVETIMEAGVTDTLVEEIEHTEL